MADTTKKPNTVKSIGKKVADNGNADDYVYIPIGADADNVDRPDGSTVEDSLVNIESKKVEIIPVETLPTNDIKEYPFVYALVRPNETKGILYEYRNNEWIPYGNGSNGIWLGTKEECAKEFNNIENGTIVIIINKNEDTGETHTHDYVCFVTKEPTYSQSGIKTYICYLCGDSYTEEVPALVDSIKPAGVIRIGNNEYSSWKDSILFDTYYKDNQSVSIEATDNETGVKEIAYYLATSAISLSDIGSVNWTVYNDTFEIAPNNNYIVYVRIKDNSDNVTYICSDGIVMDNIPPVFEGLEDGGTYPTGTVLTVEEGAILTVNGQTVDLVNNTYTFSEVMDNCILSIIDKAGNESSINIIIYHVCNFVDGICNGCGKKEYEDFELTESNYTQTGLTTLEGNIQVPATFEYEGQKYKTKSVSIDGVNNITSLTLPNTVIEIGYIRSDSLETVVMTNNVISIDSFRCSNLKNIVLSTGLTKITRACFSDCTSLISIGEIGSGASVEIPATITTIETNAFYGCTNLIEAIIPEGVEIIKETIFDDCNNLKTLSIPSTLKFNTEFSNTKSITMVYFNTTDFIQPDSYFGKMCSPDGYTICFGDNVNELPHLQTSKVKEVIILSNNIKTIPFAFLNNQNLLTEFTIPNSITKIEMLAFANCTNLSNLNIPDSVIDIGSDAFKNIPHITYHGTAYGSPWGALSIN